MINFSDSQSLYYIGMNTQKNRKLGLGWYELKLLELLEIPLKVT